MQYQRLCQLDGITYNQSKGGLMYYLSNTEYGATLCSDSPFRDSYLHCPYQPGPTPCAEWCPHFILRLNTGNSLAKEAYKLDLACADVRPTLYLNLEPDESDIDETEV